MLFEIKHCIDKTNLYSVEAGSLRLAVEIAVRDRVSLRGADLSYADFRYADFRGADIRYADLRYADLRYADLRGAELEYADLTGANMRCAVWHGTEMHRTLGMNRHLITPLTMLLDQPGPIRAYKLVDVNGEGPFTGGINYLCAEKFTVSALNTKEDHQCGEGINLATLDWCMKEWRDGYRILVMEFYADKPKGNLIIPTATDGKFRVRECRRVGEKNLKDLGLTKGE